MTKKDLNNWIMYHEIHKLKRLGFSTSRIARHLGIDARTVGNRLAMSEDDFEQHLLREQSRNKVLSPYETYVKDKLTQFPDTSAAQIHDWLKQDHDDLPGVTPRTVYNFVTFVRQCHNIPFIPVVRQYFPVEELPYGDQAQVDFGEYNMRYENQKRQKVWFFAMVLSRSRMKHVWFSDHPFTAETVSMAHEKSFQFFGGIPGTIVYDQDRTMIVEENMGDVILTSTFKRYTKSRKFELHFCRKADPESKGKVENAIQYVKKNFLYNRLYIDLETLNTQALGWLGRTANALEHNYTKKVPANEHIIEKEQLRPYTPLTIENKDVKIYHVRKTNTIAYKSNFYTVPMGTYTGQGTRLMVKEKGGAIEIYDINKKLICTHQLSSGKGKTISNTNHRRDTSKSLAELISKAVGHFTDQNQAETYFKKIQTKWPRYTRDHLQAILKAIDKAPQQAIDKTLAFCLKNENINGHDFTQVLHVYWDTTTEVLNQKEIKPLSTEALKKANETPQTSNIENYENIISP